MRVSVTGPFEARRTGKAKGRIRSHNRSVANVSKPDSQMEMTRPSVLSRRQYFEHHV